MNYKKDTETYSKLIERNEKFYNSCNENKIYIKRYTHDGFNSSPGFDKRYTVYELIDIEVATGKMTIKKIASNIKENYLPWCKYNYYKPNMKIVR